MENQINPNSDLKNIELNINGIEQLNQTRKWTLFISIVGFVFIGLMILAAILMFSVSKDNTSADFSVLSLLPLLLLTIVYYFPIYFLFEFSSYSKQAIVSNNPELLTQALKYLRKHYQFMGIFIIVVTAIYLILGVTILGMGGLKDIY